MKDPSKTKPERIKDISTVKQRIRELEQSESEWKKAEFQREAALKELRIEE
jgi:hypothetical protein